AAAISAVALSPAPSPGRVGEERQVGEQPQAGEERQVGEEPQAGGERRAGEPASGKGTVTTQEPTRAQQVVARRMASSKATVPEFTLAAEIDMARCVELRGRLKALHGDRPVASYNDIVVKACGVALAEHPRANGSWRDGRFEL